MKMNKLDRVMDGKNNGNGSGICKSIKFNNKTNLVLEIGLIKGYEYVPNSTTATLSYKLFLGTGYFHKIYYSNEIALKNDLIQLNNILEPVNLVPANTEKINVGVNNANIQPSNSQTENAVSSET